MIQFFLSAFASSNTTASVDNGASASGGSGSGSGISNPNNNIPRVPSMETTSLASSPSISSPSISSLSSSLPISHPLLRNQWTPRTTKASPMIVSPSTSPLVTRYSSVSSSASIADLHDSSSSFGEEVFSIFASLD
jgi:hypothetical protein